MKKEYAILPDRIKAAVIDSCILIITMYTASETLNLLEFVPDYARITIAILFFVLYDPFFTSYLGGTIGHTFSNITVKKDTNRDKNISLPKAFLRFFIKMALGWVSMLTVTGNDKNKAIHDIAIDSVVLKYKS